MKPLYYLVAILIAFSSQFDKRTNNLQEVVRVEYYRMMVFRESPYAPIKGAHQISEKEAEHCLHFKVQYDSENRPVLIEYRRGNNLFPHDATNRVFFPYFLRAPKTVIEYLEDKEIRTFFDIRNEPMTVSGLVFKEIYNYVDGERVNLAFFSRNDTPIENDWGIHNYEWKKLSNGRVQEKRFNIDGEQARIRPEFEFYAVQMEYDERGFIKRLYNYGLEGELTNNSTGVAYDELRYNSAGDFEGWSVFDVNGNPVEGNDPMVHRGEHSHNSKGYFVEYKSYDAEGNLMSDRRNSQINKRFYNDWGDFVQSRYYDLNEEKLTSEERRPAIVDFKINEKGYISEITFLDETAELVDWRPPKMRSVYSSDGRLKEISFWDVDYNLVDRYPHRYDDRGRLIEIDRIEGNDSLLYTQKRTYDDLDRPTGFKNFLPDGTPTIGRGIHEMRYTYDANWRRTETQHDIEGKQINR
ncbi:hypothetical protein [Flagellimonas nanhaiensis]|uniref:RHS repeat protein n=1 Tax=Flagellimonas nanhaiensis TaxID=2292706 RepID=A0A371JLQ9_9FLAO|nr:hypothetical protein [Allomuricauda nanhaiensis]RDY57896.1 hypothetical protein DX873_17255 [Allomuricauda nanhaiensis]